MRDPKLKSDMLFAAWTGTACSAGTVLVGLWKYDGLILAVGALLLFGNGLTAAYWHRHP